MSIEVGAKLKGKVSGITNFGAFIDLGAGKTGLVHISEVSNGFVKDINEVLKVKDEVTVVVTTVGNDGKIGLSIRKAQDNPPEEKREFPKKEFQRPQAKKLVRFIVFGTVSTSEFFTVAAADWASLVHLY